MKGKPSSIGDAGGLPISGQVIPINKGGGKCFDGGDNGPLRGGSNSPPRGGDSDPLGGGGRKPKGN
jgi:hypothetical protein